MTPVLRTVLLLLVLVNLCFVHITWVVGAGWLAPLACLTVLSPLLVRFQERFLYRAFWNSGVLVIFAVLLNDATSSGVRFMLEDGLILSAFCQVHLLNNLSREQKPDLLFFNSFLIALVTCFFSQDLPYLFVFLCYVPLLILALQMACVSRDTQRLATPRGDTLPTWSFVRQGLRRSVVLMAITAAVFVTVPRDFQREGLVGSHLRFEGSAPNEIGFSEEVKLGRSGPTNQSTRVVLEVELLKGSASEVPSHWRGATFTSYNSRGWTVEHRLQSNWESSSDAWRQKKPGIWSRNKIGWGPTLRVEVEDPKLGRMFAPLNTRQVALAPPADPMLGSALRDGTLRYVRLDHSDPRLSELRYGLRLHRDTIRLGGRHDRTSLRRSMEYWFLPDREIPIAARAFLDRALEGVESDAAQHVVVERVRAALSQRFSYLLPGETGAASDLEEFLSGEAGGHCEYFATALALMLRTRKIPCRLVTGFLAREWDDAQRSLTIRSRDAHAWLEVLDPQAGWYVVDPTPERARAATADGESWFAQAGAAMRKAWASVTSFDGDSYDAVLVWLGALPGRIASFAQRRPVPTLGLLGLLLTLVVLSRRRRNRLLPPHVSRYLRAVRRSGLQPHTSETPRELVNRARVDGLRADRLEELVAATRAHEQARYGDCRR